VGGEYSFHAQDFPEGILLPRLPLHVGEGRGSVTAAGGLGNFFLTGAPALRAESSKPQAPSSREAPNIKLQRIKARCGAGLKFGAWDFFGAWILVLGASEKRPDLEISPATAWTWFVF
jgi:hypothetical protein